MSDVPGSAILAGSLDPEMRRDLEQVSRSIPSDDGGGSSLLKVLVLGHLIASEGLDRVVEIGVYRGKLMLPLARLMRLLGRGEVVGIDPYSAEAAIQRDVEREGINLVEWPSTVDWEGLHQEVLDAISRWGLEGHARLLRQRAEDAAGSFASAPIDLLHVDGNHDREAVTQDVELYLPYLRDGGYLVMDDVAWPSVRPLYERLVREHELVFELVENGVYLWPHDGPNEFGVLRVRKQAAAA